MQNPPKTFTAKASIVLTGGSGWIVFTPDGTTVGNRIVLSQTTTVLGNTKIPYMTFNEVRVSSTHVGPVEAKILTFPGIKVPCPS